MEEKTDSYKELQPGTELSAGKYIIEKKIGEGGFGITYKAVQAGLNRVVCIKEYFPAGSCVRDTYAKTIHLQGMDEDRFERYRKAFVKEAQTVAALHHPGIVEVTDVFDENNTSYMVMPFIEGRSLQSIVEKNGPISYPEAVNYMAQIANAVGYIHERHILHRDIKPDNIMVTAEYKAILIDFGAAREFEEDKTQAQTSMLTHGYAPTEQYTRNSRKGAYTDIYAIGATLYFILTGKVPMEAAARITETMPEPKELNPDLPDEANRTIMKAMQLKSQNRHQSIGEFMDDLRNIKPSKPIEIASSVQQETETIPAAPKKKNAPRWLLPLVVGLSLVAAATGIYFAFIFKSPQEREALAHVEEYNRVVSDCNHLIGIGGNEDPTPLLSARQLLDSVVRPLDNKYGNVLVDVYNHSHDIEKALYPKLEAAAGVWSATARSCIAENRDYKTACQYFEYSLSLWNDPQVKEELKDAHRMSIGSKVNKINNSIRASKEKIQSLEESLQEDN